MGELDRLMEAAKRGDVGEVTAVVREHARLVNERDEMGATALHHAAFGGHCDVAEVLVKHGADVNARDGKFGATPAGWAIEYLREMGGFLGIELADFEFAIQKGDVEWVRRWVERFPALREARDGEGRLLRDLARELGNEEILGLFG
jgi:hypothetical protein